VRFVLIGDSFTGTDSVVLCLFEESVVMNHQSRRVITILLPALIVGGCSVSGTLSFLDGRSQKIIDLSTDATDVGSVAILWRNGDVTVRVDDEATEITATGSILVTAATQDRSDAAIADLDVTVTVAESFPLQVFLRFDAPREVAAFFSANVEVVLPPGVTISVDNDSGDVTVTGSTVSATVTVDNGGIVIDSASGDVDARSTNGAVVVVARPDENATVAAESTNGAVSISVPASTAADLTLFATLGTFGLELEAFTITDFSTSSSSVSATLNGGGAQITGRTRVGELSFGSF
jgi:pseudouridine-5'-phosphate glycosidase